VAWFGEDSSEEFGERSGSIWWGEIGELRVVVGNVTNKTGT
jgi:hypothetical protein